MFLKSATFISKNMLTSMKLTDKITICYNCNLFLLNQLLVSYLLIYLQNVRVKKQLM